MSAVAGALFSTAGNMLNSMINNMWASQMASEDRSENYRYGEMAARNADKRTRALYNDFYSPAALLRQYQEAGLSPSLMFGGTPGQGGMSGAQGTGAAGIQTHFTPMSLVDAAQAAALFAQADKTKEETKNVAQDTKLKELEQRWKEMQTQVYADEYNILQTGYGENGENLTLYQLANRYDNYDDFLKHMQETHYVGQKATEEKVLRKAFFDANRFDTDIRILSDEKTSAKFHEKLLDVLEQKDFQHQSAEVTLKQLKAAGESADLTSEQKGAWNHIIEKLYKTNSTVADILIVASMIINQAASNWNMPQIHTHNNYRTTNYVQ